MPSKIPRKRLRNIQSRRALVEDIYTSSDGEDFNPEEKRVSLTTPTVFGDDGTEGPVSEDYEGTLNKRLKEIDIQACGGRFSSKDQIPKDPELLRKITEASKIEDRIALAFSLPRQLGSKDGQWICPTPKCDFITSKIETLYSHIAMSKNRHNELKPVIRQSFCRPCRRFCKNPAGVLAHEVSHSQQAGCYERDRLTRLLRISDVADDHRTHSDSAASSRKTQKRKRLSQSVQRPVEILYEQHLRKSTRNRKVVPRRKRARSSMTTTPSSNPIETGSPASQGSSLCEESQYVEEDSSDGSGINPNTTPDLGPLDPELFQGVLSGHDPSPMDAEVSDRSASNNVSAPPGLLPLPLSSDVTSSSYPFNTSTQHFIDENNYDICPGTDSLNTFTPQTSPTLMILDHEDVPLCDAYFEELLRPLQEHLTDEAMLGQDNRAGSPFGFLPCHDVGHFPDHRFIPTHVSVDRSQGSNSCPWRSIDSPNQTLPTYAQEVEHRSLVTALVFYEGFTPDLDFSESDGEEPRYKVPLWPAVNSFEEWN